MNENIRFFGWAILSVGGVLFLLGIFSFTDFIHLQIETIGLDVDTLVETVAWVVCWLVFIAVGGFLIGLTYPENQNRTNRSF